MEREEGKGQHTPLNIPIHHTSHSMQHLFSDEKPFFWTYFKTTLFSIYLSAFIFWRPWQHMCLETCVGSKKREEREERRERLRDGGGGGGGRRWTGEGRMKINCTQVESNIHSPIFAGFCR